MKYPSFANNFATVYRQLTEQHQTMVVISAKAVSSEHFSRYADDDLHKQNE